MNDSPVLPYRNIIHNNPANNYLNRLMIGTATLGLVRMEWVLARYGQVVPVNWGAVSYTQNLNTYIPMRYQVADAQNLIVKTAIEGEFEWLLLLEDDTMPPPDAFIRFNTYIREERVPIVSGLYFTKSHPAEPLLFRGRGTSYFDKWKLGDLVWCDGVPTGMLLIHCGILREMWKESPEYSLNGAITRRVFDTPRNVWIDPETNQFNTTQGTSDLDWCTRVMKGNYLRKAGWTEYVDKEFPFLVDTNIFCYHIDRDGVIYPRPEELERYKPETPSALGVAVSESVGLKEKTGG